MNLSNSKPKSFGRRSIIATVATLPLARFAWANSFPTKPVKLVVPFTPGTAADIIGRQLGSRLADLWGQSVVIENQPGAGGNIGAAIVARATPDGHTLAVLGLNHAINPSLYTTTGYDLLRDFRPIAKIASVPLAIVVNPKFGPNNIQELVALAKAKPGEIHYGSSGSGSVTHLTFELLKLQTGVRMVHVPYKGVAPMLADILGNHIPIGAPAAASVVSHVKTGALKILAVTSPKRSSAFPDVPSVAEQGFTGFDVTGWNGLVAPAGTPEWIISKIYADVLRIAQAPDFMNLVRQQNMEMDLLGPADYGREFVADLAKWSRLIKVSGAKVD